MDSYINITVLKDIVTFIKIQQNENYKERLIEAYYELQNYNINSAKELENSNTGIGAFTYAELTIFDRLADEEYYRIISSFIIELNSALNIPEDYGDILASYGTIGDTPYREEYIKKGFIKTNKSKKKNKK